MVKEIKTKVEFDEAIQNTALVVVDFYAVWCGPCRMIAPKIEEMEKEFTDVVFLKVNVDEVADVAESRGISAMPTFKFFKNGEEVSEVVGASEEKIKQEIEKNK